jgi:hypothetical protein
MQAVTFVLWDEPRKDSWLLKNDSGLDPILEPGSDPDQALNKIRRHLFSIRLGRPFPLVIYRKLLAARFYLN